VKQCVILATPCLNHAVALEFLRSAVATTHLLSNRFLADGDFGFSWQQRAGDCFVAKVRSKLVGEFLDNPHATDLFFIDDDLGWPPEKVLEFLDRPEPILAGAYPKRSDTLDWPVSLLSDAATGELIEDQGLIAADLAATGFMRIKRAVLEALYPLGPVFREREADGVERQWRAVFNSGPADDGQWWGEDYHFCNLARANGFDIWVDPSIEFHHRGQKRYTGTLAQSLDQFRARARQAARSAA